MREIDLYDTVGNHLYLSAEERSSLVSIVYPSCDRCPERCKITQLLYAKRGQLRGPCFTIITRNWKVGFIGTDQFWSPFSGKP